MKPINKAQVLDHLTHQIINNGKFDKDLEKYLESKHGVGTIGLKVLNPKQLVKSIKEYYSQPEIKLNAKLERMK